MIEEYLLRRAQDGDKEALDRLIRKYYDQIYAYCYHKTNDRGAAEDICQDTFVSMLEHMGDYRHYNKFLNFLYVIAGNKCKDYFKKKKPVYMEDVAEETLREVQGTDTAEEQILMKELVNTLPSELREVIILRFYQDLKYQDIARILQISSSLVKYRVKKAISYLQAEMERSGE